MDFKELYRPQGLMKILLSLFLISTFCSYELSGTKIVATAQSDADLLLEKIFRHPDLIVDDLQSEYLTGDPKVHNIGNISLVQFHSKVKDSLVFVPKIPAYSCPWDLSSCKGDTKISFTLAQSDFKSNAHIMTLALEDSIRITVNRNAQEKKLLVQVEAKSLISRIYSVEYEESNLLKVVLKVNIRETALNEVFLNGERLNVVLVPHPKTIRPSIIEEESDFVGLVFGGGPNGSFEIGQVDIEGDDTRKLVKRNSYSVTSQGNMMSVGSTPSINFQGPGYVKYDFKDSDRIPVARYDEEIIIKFILPVNNREGVLWNARGDKSETLIYIKDAKLYYYFQSKDSSHEASRTITEEVVLNKALEPNRIHSLTMKRVGDQLTVILNSEKKTTHLSESSTLLPNRGELFLGGTPNLSLDTGNRVNYPFLGNISQVHFYVDTTQRTLTREYDLVKMTTDPEWKKYVRPSANVSYQVNIREPIDHSNLIIGPTRGYEHSSQGVYEKQAVHLDGSNQAVVRAGTWDFKKYPYFEIEFKTFEPEGVLFFVGPNEEHTDFICIEIYDGNIYFVYGIGDHYRHIQLNVDQQKVNDGSVHRVYVEKTPEDQVITKFNGKAVNIDQRDYLHPMQFSSYTYFGSIDQPGRLPWYVWTRKNFAGCILSVRIGERKYLDFTLIMNQHNDATSGVYLGCKSFKKVCGYETCNGGRCEERSEPMFQDHKKMACDCSSTEKTYNSGVEILRSEKCMRTAPILDFDGKSSKLIEFNRVQKTHTDDFRLQFKTKNPNVPLFHTYSQHESQYFKVDLYNGKIKLRTNINRVPHDQGEKHVLFDLEDTSALNDGQWHNLRINRRAQYITIDVDDRYSKIGEIPTKDGKTFNLIAQYVFLGAEAPNCFDCFSMQDYLTLENQDAAEKKFEGSMRNFYWNQYDLSGNPAYGRVYSSHVAAPKFRPPELPPFRGSPNYAATATAKLISMPLVKEIDFERMGDSIMLYFKTKYEGNVLHTVFEESRGGPEFSYVILDGKMFLVYSVGDKQGVYQWRASSNFNDNQWHRLVFTINRRDGELITAIDNYPAEYVDERFDFSRLGNIKINVAGVADSIWRKTYQILRSNQASKTLLTHSQRSPPFTGCVGHLAFAENKFSQDYLQTYRDLLRPSPTESDVIFGRCLDVDRCTPGYCGTGECIENAVDHTISCRCSHGYMGARCQERDQCQSGYCLNSGYCRTVGKQPVCDCSNTGYTGQRCEISPCMTNYCGVGKCSMIGNRPHCDCFNTGFLGDRCDVQICTPGICGAGTCRVVGSQPVCDCLRTGFSGPRCEKPLCKPNPCKNGGVCRINGYEETCECHGTGYTGQFCIEPTCENNNFCLNGGLCRVDYSRRSLTCDCSRTGYTGQRCEHRVIATNPCDGVRCQNGGRCVVRNNIAECDCVSTGYEGRFCESSLCSRFRCDNGVCEIRGGSPYCKCHDGFSGLYCSEQICDDGFCLNGGSCYVYNGRKQCNCLPNYEGGRCERPKTCRPDYCLHGNCRVMSDGRYQCDCHDGYTGDKCENSKNCPLNYCNGGKCSVNNGQFICDCSPTGKSGDRCQEDSDAFLSEYLRPGYLVYNFWPSKKTTKDSVTVGFKTYAEDGTIIAFESPNKAYWALRIEDGTLLFEENGRKPFSIKQNVNDARYYVVQVDRMDKLMNITVPGTSVQTTLEGFEPTYSNGIDYKRIIIGANSTEQDIFRGAIGGVHWNGNYIITEAKNSPTQYQRDHITFIRLPSFNIPIPPNVQCTSGYCENYGVCMINNYQRTCDCKITGYWGERCEKQYYGFLDNDRNKGTYTKILLEPERNTRADQMRYAFQTREPSGVLTHAEQADGTVYHQTFLENGYLWANLNGKKEQISDRRLDDGAYHVVNLDRVNDQFKYYVDGNIKTITDYSTVNSNGELKTKTIFVGADRSGENNFKGLLGAFSWNDQELISKEGKFTQNTQVMSLPDNRPGNPNEVLITVMPSFQDTFTVAPPMEIPSIVPNTGGGALMNQNGDLILAGNDAGLMTGGGASNIFPGGGVRIQNAGFLGGMPQISALAAGIILSLLLLLSGLIWACWKCKPGGCGKGGSGGILKKAAGVFGRAGGEKDPYIGRGGNPYQNIPGMEMDENQLNNNMVQPVNAEQIETNNIAPNYDHVEMNENTNLLAGAAGAGMNSNIGHGKMLDMSPGMDLNSYRMENNFVETGGPNVYSTDMKVDCCEISQNSKYAVTGSANGPPQVWDMVSGDLFKVMDGSELAARDLHLGCNDQVLVGQVVDENDIDSYVMTNGARVRRLQLWHFQSGQQMEMQEKIMCSASCLTTRDKNDLIVARTQPKSDSILVWDLIGNENKQEIFYNRLSDAPVTFLKVSLDDRLVVAGFETGENEPTVYMVFDLCAEHSHVVNPNHIEFDAEVNATEILSDFEAITGTRKGHLFVWNMLTCEPIRQIQISAVIEDNTMVALPAHNDLIHCVTLSKDGQYIVTGSRDQTVKVWKRSEERLLHCLEGHNDDVLSTFISPDSEVIVSGSWDGSIRVWRLRDGNQMCWFTSNIEILQVKLSNDKRAIVGLGERNGNRKLIMLQIIRNRTTVYGPNGSLSPSLGPASP